MDTIDNPVKIDDEFVPTSEKQWNTERYQTKLDHIGQVIASTGVQLPVIVGLAEIENRFVLEDLVKEAHIQADIMVSCSSIHLMKEGSIVRCCMISSALKCWMPIPFLFICQKIMEEAPATFSM